MTFFNEFNETHERPPGMTEEQLNFFTEQNRYAVTKALNRYRTASLAAFLILFVGILLALYVNNDASEKEREAIVRTGRIVSVDSCNARYRDREALRDLFVRLQTAVVQQAKTEGLSPDAPQVKFAIQFYKDELKRLPLPDCRRTEQILSSDPDKQTYKPTPLHP